MPRTSHSLLNYLRTAAGAWREDPRDDAELLARFVDGDEEAFRVLVWRHGPLVWRACVRVLGDGPDSEDAFQVAFLALARKAGQLRREPLAGWLHRVARQTALNTDAEVQRRRRLEQHLRAAVQREEANAGHTELYAALDEELADLPERLRVPLILHYLQGKTQDEVAHILGCSRRATQKRLLRGEAVLRERLERRGLAVGVGSVAVLLVSSVTVSAVPTHLIGSTARAALRSLTFPLPESSGVAALTGELMKTMLVTKMKIVTLLLGAMLCLAGGGVLAYQALAENAAAAPQAASESREETEASRQPATTARVDCYGDPLPDGALARLGTVRLRHPGWVNSVVFSPDGKTMASGGRDRSVCLWEVASGKLIRILKGHPGPTSAMAFSLDGKTVASGTEDGKVYLWETATGKSIRTLQGQKGEKIWSVAFSPDGKAVASGVWDLSGEGGATVRLWEVATAREIHTLKRNKGVIYSVAFSPDGKVVATGGDDVIIHLSEVATGKEICSVQAGGGPVAKVAFSPDGKIMASGSAGGTVRLWEAATGKEIRSLPGHSVNIHSIAFSPDGKIVASGGWGDGIVRLSEVGTGKELRTLQAAIRWVEAIAFSPDGRIVASGGGIGKINLWETATGKPIHMSEGHKGCVISAAFSPDGKTVVSGADDGTVRLWEAATGKEIRTIKGTQGEVVSVAFSPNGKTVVSGTDDGMVCLWEAATGKKIRNLKGHQGGVLSVAFSPDGEIVASGGGGQGIVRLCEAATGNEVRTLQAQKMRSVCSVAFSPDGKIVASGGQADGSGGRLDGRVHLWEAITGKEIRTLPTQKTNVRSVAFSPDSRIVALVTWEKDDETVGLWEITTGKLICTLQAPKGEDPVLNVGATFSSDGRILAIGGGACVQLWDLSSGDALPPLTGHRSHVLGVAFSPDGRALVSVSTDATGLVWRMSPRTARPAIKPNAACPAIKPDADALRALWADLASKDAARAWGAIWTLAETPADSVPLLQARLRPVPANMEKRLTQWVADLDADEFKLRETARRGLEGLGLDAEPVLRKGLEGKPSLEKRRRLEQLLEQNQRGAFSGEFLRGLRAVAVLELAGTSQARQVLKILAAGAPGCRLTQEAQLALKRLDQTGRR